MKKAKFLTIPLLTTLLAGCSSSSLAGQYVFQMGKSNSTHFGIYLTLFEENVLKEKDPEKGKILGKKLSLDFDFESVMQQQANNESIYQASKELGNSVYALASKADEPEYDVGNSFGFDGYYNYQKDSALKDDEGNQIVGVGVTSVFDIDDKGQKHSYTLDLPSQLLEKIVYSTIADSVFTLVIPVSWEDLMLQLYWYGLDVTGSDSPKEHQVGTSPTQTEIDEINKTYPSTHEGKTFRKFHKLHMGLSKR